MGFLQLWFKSNIMFKRIKKRIELITLNYVLSHDKWSHRRKAYETLRLLKNKKVSIEIYSQINSYKLAAIGNNIIKFNTLVGVLNTQLQQGAEIQINNVYCEATQINLSKFFTQDGYYVDINKHFSEFVQLSIQLCLLTESFDNIYEAKGFINYKLINLYNTITQIGEILLTNNLFE